MRKFSFKQVNRNVLKAIVRLTYVGASQMCGICGQTKEDEQALTCPKHANREKEVGRMIEICQIVLDPKVFQDLVTAIARRAEKEWIFGFIRGEKLGRLFSSEAYEQMVKAHGQNFCLAIFNLAASGIQARIKDKKWFREQKLAVESHVLAHLPDGVAQIDEVVKHLPTYQHYKVPAPLARRIVRQELERREQETDAAWREEAMDDLAVQFQINLETYDASGRRSFPDRSQTCRYEGRPIDPHDVWLAYLDAWDRVKAAHARKEAEEERRILAEQEKRESERAARKELFPELKYMLACYLLDSPHFDLFEMGEIRTLTYVGDDVRFSIFRKEEIHLTHKFVYWVAIDSGRMKPPEKKKAAARQPTLRVVQGHQGSRRKERKKPVPNVYFESLAAQAAEQAAGAKG